MQGRVIDIACELDEGGEDEVAFGDRRMRDRQSELRRAHVDDGIAVEQDVEIDRARRPTPGGPPADVVLDPLDEVEQRFRRQRCRDLARRVHVVGPGRCSIDDDGSRTVQRRHRDDLALSSEPA